MSITELDVIAAYKRRCMKPDSFAEIYSACLEWGKTEFTQARMIVPARKSFRNEDNILEAHPDLWKVLAMNEDFELTEWIVKPTRNESGIYSITILYSNFLG